MLFVKASWVHVPSFGDVLFRVSPAVMLNSDSELPDDDDEHKLKLSSKTNAPDSWSELR